MKYFILQCPEKGESAIVVHNTTVLNPYFLTEQVSRGYFSIDCVGGLFVPSVSPEKKERLELDKGILTQLLNNEI